VLGCQAAPRGILKIGASTKSRKDLVIILVVIGPVRWKAVLTRCATSASAHGLAKQWPTVDLQIYKGRHMAFSDEDRDEMGAAIVWSQRLVVARFN
jgi:hypothetical protein